MNKFRDNKIEDISHSKESIQLVFKAIKDLNSHVKLGDLIIKTGLSIHNIEDSLEALIKVHQCRFHVDKEGNLVYDFKFEDENILALKRVSQKLILILKKTAIIAFKSWIAFMLLGYFWVYFPAITIYYIPEVLMFVGVGLLEALVMAFPFLCLLSISYFLLKGLLYNYWIKGEAFLIRKLGFEKPENAVINYKNPKEKGFFSGDRLFYTEKIKFRWNFIKTVFNYVFGEKIYTKIDKLQLEKRILTFINVNHKRITISELIAITGWDIIKAETEMTKIFVKYHGKVSVTNEGAIIYNFPAIESKHLNTQNEYSFVWNNLIKIKPWNRNFTFENNLITFFGFMVFLSSGIMTLLKLEIPIETHSPIFQILNHHWFPFIFSIIFFLVTISNKFHYGKFHKKLIQEFNEYALTLNKIFHSPNEIKSTNSDLIKKAITELDGVILNDDEGNIFYQFPYLIRDLGAISKKTNIDLNKRYKILEEHHDFAEEAYNDDFEEGKKELLAENILSIESQERVTLYMKLTGNNTGFKLYALSTLSILFLIPFISFLSEGKIDGAITILLPLSASSIGMFYQLFNLFNTTIIRLENDNLILNHLPFNLFKKKKVIALDEVESIYIKQHGRNFYKLTLSIASENFPITLIEFIKDKKLIEEIRFRIFDYMEERLML